MPNIPSFLPCFSISQYFLYANAEAWPRTPMLRGRYTNRWECSRCSLLCHWADYELLVNMFGFQWKDVVCSFGDDRRSYGFMPFCRWTLVIEYYVEKKRFGRLLTVFIHSVYDQIWYGVACSRIILLLIIFIPWKKIVSIVNIRRDRERENQQRRTLCTKVK